MREEIKFTLGVLILYFNLDVSSLTMHTEDVVAILQEDNSIVLNCTFHKDAKEDIAKRNIGWQKQINGGFEDIALFSPPGKQEPFIVKEKHPLYNNRTILVAPNTSMAAVMIIKDPDCSDEGIYRCWIKYFSDSSVKTKTSKTIVGFVGKYVLLMLLNFVLKKKLNKMFVNFMNIEKKNKLKYNMNNRFLSIK